MLMRTKSCVLEKNQSSDVWVEALQVIQNIIPALRQGTSDASLLSMAKLLRQLNATSTLDDEIEKEMRNVRWYCTGSEGLKGPAGSPAQLVRSLHANLGPEFDSRMLPFILNTPHAKLWVLGHAAHQGPGLSVRLCC
ncbi:hypothetical protein VNO77_23229 [Canavalia gladiata]|uniref:Uncharacterized protein n=1 Tax=Canavalia gladiata TaxID=3824 RepID=A0AAN9L7E6_CANGL